MQPRTIIINLIPPDSFPVAHYKALSENAEKSAKTLTQTAEAKHHPRTQQDFLDDFHCQLIIKLLQGFITYESLHKYIEDNKLTKLFDSTPAYPTHQDHSTQLHVMVQSCSSDAIKTLFRAAANFINPNKRSPKGTTLLIFAAKSGDLRLLTRLGTMPLAKKTNINAYDTNGRTALHYACKLNDIESVKRLISFGANTNALDFMGVTPLKLTTDSAIKKLIMRHSKSADIKDEKSTSQTNQSSALVTTSSNSWRSFSNEDVLESWCYEKETGTSSVYDPYKIHIAIPFGSYKKVHGEINKLLLEATKKGIIRGYKFLALEYVEANSKTTTAHNGRLENMPFCLYLLSNYDSDNANKVAALSLAIESILKKHNIPPATRDNFTSADLPLSEYVFFRTTILDPLVPGYIAANSDQAKLLAKAGLKSQYYRHFDTAFKQSKLIKPRHHVFDVWNVWMNPTIPEIYCTDASGETYNYDPYKLHISISSAQYHRVADKIDVILLEAIRNSVIKDFKRLDILLAESWTGDLTRVYEIPCSLYLFHEYNSENANAVVELCLQIENFLKNLKIPPGRKDVLTAADIELSEYFTFRMTTVDPAKLEYIASDDKRSDLLITSTQQSKYFKHLKAALQKKPSIAAMPYSLSDHVMAGNSPIGNGTATAPAKTVQADTHAPALTKK